MKRVGLLCGREYSFPPAFIVRVNELGKKDGVAAEFVKLGGTRMGEAARYSVIVDRISHEVEYYRGYLKHAALQGTSCRRRVIPATWILQRSRSTTWSIQWTGTGCSITSVGPRS